MESNTDLAVIEIILSAGIEDYSPIYSIFWEINSLYEDVNPELKKQNFKKMLALLLNKGLIELCKDYSHDANSKIFYFEKNQALEIIINDSDNYLNPTPKYEDNICIETTKTGKEAYSNGDLKFLLGS